MKKLQNSGQKNNRLYYYDCQAGILKFYIFFLYIFVSFSIVADYYCSRGCHCLFDQLSIMITEDIHHGERYGYEK